MSFITHQFARQHIRHHAFHGSNHRFLHDQHGDGFLDWIKGIATSVLPILKPILAPAAKIAEETLLPAALGALESGSTEGLKSALIKTVKEATPGILERGSKVGLEQLHQIIPEDYRDALKPAIDQLSKSAQQVANHKLAQWTATSGQGLRQTKARKKEIR